MSNQQTEHGEHTLNIGPGPFPLSIHGPVVSDEPSSGGPARPKTDGHRARRIARALPSPDMVAVIGLMTAVVINPSNMLLVWVALAYCVYGLASGAVSDALDPECTVPGHHHDDCAACGDLPPLVPVQSTLTRLTRKVTAR